MYTCHMCVRRDVYKCVCTRKNKRREKTVHVSRRQDVHGGDLRDTIKYDIQVYVCIVCVHKALKMCVYV